MWDLIVSVPDHCLSFYFTSKQSIYLRNKFYFSEVHGSMNATGHVQSK